MPDASAPPWAQSEKDREKRRLKVSNARAIKDHGVIDFNVTTVSLILIAPLT
jgi:hypothetical protein